jgi:hypothetical protein
MQELAQKSLVFICGWNLSSRFFSLATRFNDEKRFCVMLYSGKPKRMKIPDSVDIPQASVKRGQR